MIVATRIFINTHFGSGSRRDFIRAEFKSQKFPGTENKIIKDYLSEIQSVEGNIDFFRLGENENSLLTDDGLFLCATGEISINKKTKSAFSYYEISLENKIWDRFRADAMINYTKNLLIYFSRLYGKVEAIDENYISLKVKLEFEKIVWGSKG